MPALDTNVLVRFIVEDDITQLAIAKKLIDQCVRAGETLYVPISVTLELEWVLRASFGFKKTEIVHTLVQLLSTVELSFASEKAIEIALAQYRQGTADYSDCLHIALAAQAGEEPLWTFDKAAAKLAGAQLLT